MVRSYVSLLEKEYGDDLDEEAGEFIDFAVDGADRMKALIDGLLEFSRVETHGDDIAPCDSAAIVADARQTLRLKIEETDASVTAGDLPMVPADPPQHQQVFQNLLENAIEYAGDEPPTVEITAHERDEAVIFAVADEGVGIPEAELDRIFGLFERGADAEGEGTGIGLAISNRIVERHEGAMWVESTEGEGTTVYFSLPTDATDGGSHIQDRHRPIRT
jgi:light-regulated signal transduction histidine kinase (bacteriophytochrome)